MSVLPILTQIFPPPRFLTMPNAGLDISDASLKYVQFARRRKQLSLLRWGDIPVPEGTVNRGDVLNKDALVDVLREARAKCEVDYVRVSLPEERAYLFETTIKRETAYRDIRGLLEFRLEENVPLSPRDAFFDYNIVEDDVNADVLRVGVAVYARETIMGYYDACCAAGLVPLSFEVEAQAIARAAVRTGEQGTHLIVDFGQTRTGVGIVHRGSLMFTSTIDVGGAQLSEVLRAVLGDREEKELTTLKNEHGLLKTAENKAMCEALLKPVSALKEELAMRINYWHSRGVESEKRHIEKIILCGGSANLAGLPEFLGEELGVPAERALVWQNAFSVGTQVPPIGRRYSYGYATAIGLALTDFIGHV